MTLYSNSTPDGLRSKVKSINTVRQESVLKEDFSCTDEQRHCSVSELTSTSVASKSSNLRKQIQFQDIKLY